MGAVYMVLGLYIGLRGVSLALDGLYQPSMLSGWPLVS